MKLDTDLENISKGATSPYQSERDPALGQAQVYTIQAIRNLQKKIVSLDKQNGVLNNRLFWLTVTATVVAVLQAIEIVKNLI